jgi:archaellum component FlaC
MQKLLGYYDVKDLKVIESFLDEIENNLWSQYAKKAYCKYIDIMSHNLAEDNSQEEAMQVHEVFDGIREIIQKMEKEIQKVEAYQKDMKHHY